jgi:hypothetical protein
MIWAGLQFLSFQGLRRLLARWMRVTYPAPVEKVTWAMTVASRYVPASTCLSRALATQTLLRRGGHLSSLRIGVARDKEGALQAHAWVENEEQIVFGNLEGLDSYTRLPPLEIEEP